MVIFTWLLLACVAGLWARRKHKSFLNYFLLSIALTPVVGLLAIGLAKPDQVKLVDTLLASGELRKCEACGAAVKWNVAKCESCGNFLKPLTPP